MKWPHLWATGSPPLDFRALMIAASAAGLRVGWLERNDEAEPPARLAEAAGSGALRAVAVAPGWTVSVKKRKGEPVLADVVREHFLGCRLVLIAGPLPAGTSPLPRLSRVNLASPIEAEKRVAPGAALWRLDSANETVTLTTEDLLMRLRRPVR